MAAAAPADNFTLLKNQYKIIENEVLLHEKAHSYYTNTYYYLNLTNIILLSCTSIINFINQLYRENFVVSVFVVIFLFVSSISSSILHFLNYEKQAEAHLTKANAYKSLMCSIKKYLIDPKEKYNEYYLWITKKYEDLKINSPAIPGIVLKKYNTHIELTELVISNEIEESAFEPESSEMKYQIDRWIWLNELDRE